MTDRFAAAPCAFAPWVIHGLWLVAGVATVGYLKSRDWGMFEAIPLMMAAAFGMAAWIDWTIAWALLARQPIIDEWPICSWVWRQTWPLPIRSRVVAQ